MMQLPSDQDASGRSFGQAELDALAEVLKSGTLTATKGAFTPRLESAVKEMLGIGHVAACSSGSAAVHTAVAALDIEPGEEIITTAITDMGALSAIIYQGGIPVFADVDADTLNVTAATIERELSPRTRGIIVTHLFGNPCEMDAIMALAGKHAIPVIEDTAQAYGASFQGKAVGTFGAIGAFSAQQGKHITAGEGGWVVTDDDAYARRMRMFINKAWPYGEANPDHEFLAPNYRITELQSAVLYTQFPTIPDNVARRVDNARLLTEMVADLEGLGSPVVRDGDVCSYWRYALRVDPEVIAGGPVGLSQKLKFYDVAAAPRYVNKPAFRCKVIADQVTFGTSNWPFNLARPEALDYSDERYQGSWRGLDQVLVFPWNERMTSGHVEHVGSAIRAAVKESAK
jgi:perosamine synthetase